MFTSPSGYPMGGEILKAELGHGSTLGKLALIRLEARTVTAIQPVEVVYTA